MTTKKTLKSLPVKCMACGDSYPLSDLYVVDGETMCAECYDPGGVVKEADDEKSLLTRTREMLRESRAYVVASDRPEKFVDVEHIDELLVVLDGLDDDA